MDNQHLVLPEPRLWTRQEFQRATELGLFGSDERLELIEGVIVRKVTHNTPHATGIRLAENALRAVFADGYDVRGQLPLSLSDFSEPEPDVAVVTGTARDYTDAHPTTAVLVVEVSDSSLSVDRTTKAGICARAGIEEYWILNLQDKLLEVHREPAHISEQPLDHQYLRLVRLSARHTVSPLAAPGAVIRVADLLP